MYRDSVGIPPLTMVDDCISISKCGTETVEVNAYLNAKTNVKKLQYGETKCVKLHVGQKSEICPEIKINTWKVKKVKNLLTAQYEMSDEIGELHSLTEANQQKYLGDILSSNSQNIKNIEERKRKGLGIIQQIKNILEEGFFGAHHFEAALLLRESLFLNSILLNSEAWVNLNKKELNELTVVDNMLLRTIWNCSASTSVPMMFLDLGCVPINVCIMKRRIMFLHYILQQPEQSLLYKCFKAQLNNKLAGDWVIQVESDLRELKIVDSLWEIKLMTKFTLKSILKKHTLQYAFEKLMSVKKSQSKCSQVEYNELKIQSYVTTDLLTTEQKKLLFQLRSGTYPVFANQKYLHSDILCPCCREEDDTISHQLSCRFQSDVNSQLDASLTSEDIFSQDIQRQCQVTMMFDQAMNRRKIFNQHVIY